MLAMQQRAMAGSRACCPVVRPRLPARLAPPAAISTAPDSFQIPAAPDLIPDGQWEKVPEGNVTTPKGFKATGAYAGLRASGVKADLALVVADEDAVVGGTFTTNVMCAAPVLYCKDVLSRKKTVRAVMANAGQANAATGDQGYQDAVQTASALASALGVAPDDVLLQSTGVIGRRMKMDAFMTAIPEITKTLGSSQADGHRAAVAITTTDLVSKSAALRVNLGGTPVHVGGMCKGSGMIHPNMATMLGVVTCDAAVSAEAWQGMVRRASIASFNQITVDGDTSTNDCVIGLASGASGAPLITDATSLQGQQLEAALTALLQGLAKAIAWDGEGATCLMEILCVGARTDAEARQVARSVAGSHLAKAAIFGHDPNWGRLAAAAGYSGVPFDQNELGVQLGSQVLMEKGQPLVFDKAAANKYLKDTCGVHGTVNIKVTVGSGPGSGYAWGCDLSYDYVKINAEYTT
ncbi:arginine biosynthesis protein ArgJ [Haematococcus lacustris]